MQCRDHMMTVLEYDVLLQLYVPKSPSEVNVGGLNQLTTGPPYSSPSNDAFQQSAGCSASEYYSLQSTSQPCWGSFIHTRQHAGVTTAIQTLNTNYMLQLDHSRTQSSQKKKTSTDLESKLQPHTSTSTHKKERKQSRYRYISLQHNVTGELAVEPGLTCLRCA